MRTPDFRVRCRVTAQASHVPPRIYVLYSCFYFIYDELEHSLELCIWLHILTIFRGRIKRVRVSTANQAWVLEYTLYKYIYTMSVSLMQTVGGVI